MATEVTGTEVYHWGGGQVQVQPAADTAHDSDCVISGLLEAQAIGDQHSYPNALVGADTTRTLINARGTAAANLNCGNWNFQGVVSATNIFPFQYSYGNRGYTNSDIYGNGGLDVFWRDPNSFMIGVGIRRDLESEHFTGFGTWSARDFDQSWNFWYGTAFAELYPNEQVTFGLTGFYETGDSLDGFNGVDYQLQEFGGSAYARYYATSNLRFSIRGFVSQTIDTTSNATFTHLNAVASADYKLQDSPLSLFGGLRYGANNSSSSSSLEPNTYVEGFAGVRVALGPHSNGTLLERDRTAVNLH